VAFGYDKIKLATPAQKEFNAYIRKKAFELAVKHNIDMLFTYVAAFEIDKEIEYLKSLEQQFTTFGGNFFFVELSADLSTRLERNLTPHRMERKASKQNTQWSETDLLNASNKHRLNTFPNEVLFDNYLKIDNTNLTPDEVADIVIDKFSLSPNDKQESEYRFGV
jgi:hypothetical protein